MILKAPFDYMGFPAVFMVLERLFQNTSSFSGFADFCWSQRAYIYNIILYFYMFLYKYKDKNQQNSKM